MAEMHPVATFKLLSLPSSILSLFSSPSSPLSSPSLLPDSHSRPRGSYLPNPTTTTSSSISSKYSTTSSNTSLTVGKTGIKPEKHVRIVTFLTFHTLYDRKTHAAVNKTSIQKPEKHVYYIAHTFHAFHTLDTNSGNLN